MATQGRSSSNPPVSRRLGTVIREDEIESSKARLVESFPPPPIALRPSNAETDAPEPRVYRVLVACDLSEFSEGVLREAIALTHGHMPAELHLVTVVQKHKDQYILHFDETRRYVSQDVVKSLMNNVIWKVGIRKDSPLDDAMKQIALHVCVGEPAAEILRLSREIFADAIVVGSREHQGLNRRVWGSVSKTVMTHADCSVVLARPIDFVHGVRIPVVEPPRTWDNDGYHLQMHHYHF
jgi:nucleotide-binding universal stress UspA family protein